MLVIELQFLSGRYHATPWRHNVNEGLVEWPPSPYRLARSLVDVWKRRKSDWSEERVIPILKALSMPPFFMLPPATTAHTRSYLSSNQRKRSNQQLIFDAFVVVERNKTVYIGFNYDLRPESIRDLNELLGNLNYFGRSESWVRARVARKAVEGEWNCVPKTDDLSVQTGEIVQVACLLSPEEYVASPDRAGAGNWLQALCLNNKELLKEGWSDPPALRWVDYVRKEDAFHPVPRKPSPFNASFRCVKYALDSKVLPVIQDTLPFAERVRKRLMGIHKRLQDNNPELVSSVFSGKAADGKPLKGHKHAFYLPVDEDGDGRLDHLMIYAAHSFDAFELKALDRLNWVWQPKLRKGVNLILVSLNKNVPTQSSKHWLSATPFVTSRHYKKSHGNYEQWLKGEIVRECAFHQLPPPKEVEWVSQVSAKHRPIHWGEFVRNRQNKRPLQGHGCILHFEEPVFGPIVLGSCCHFGLGRFLPKP